MKSKKIFAIVAVLVLLMSLAACSDKSTVIDKPMPPLLPSGQIYLYGEQHGVKKILDKELELWSECYDNKNMRHLFVELPYYTAEFLNIWMQSDTDDILNEVYDDWIGTASYTPSTKEYYKEIKRKCPETIFHGTDVGHQYQTTGKRFLDYLKQNNKESSEQYLLAQEAIEQGKYFYKNTADAYRENKMAENFIREFDKLSGESVMGIYGAAHTEFDAMDYNTQSVPCMANQLKESYNDNIHSENLSQLVKEIEPTRVDTFVINENNYEASYFGKQDLTGFKDYSYREFWRLENAYDDFKDKPKTGDELPSDNYPMLIDIGQVFVIDYAKTDGSIARKYYISDGKLCEDMLSTQEFTAE